MKVTFDDDEPLIRGTVKLLDQNGQEVANATTDEQGMADCRDLRSERYTLRPTTAAATPRR